MSPPGTVVVCMDRTSRRPRWHPSSSPSFIKPDGFKIMCFIIQGFGHRLATSWDNNPDLAPNLIVDFGAKISETVCDSYTSPSGKIWTSTGSYFDTIPNSFGGDSIILVDLTVLESTSSSITETVCDSYISPSGKTWTVTDIYTDTIPNAAGCDSVITVDLTVIASSASSITETVCNSY